MGLIGENISSLKTEGELYLNKIVKQLKDAGIKADAEHLIGDPAEEIVKYAAAHEPRLIVMSTHGRSGFSRFVFESVTENVLHRLQKTPVFLVRPPQLKGCWRSSNPPAAAYQPFPDHAKQPGKYNFLSGGRRNIIKYIMQ